MNSLSLFRGCCVPRPNGPYRFVCYSAKLIRWHAFKHSTKLTQDDSFRLVSLTLLKRFAYANHRLNASSHETFSLKRNRFVVFTPKGATFRVTHKRQRDANVGEHGGRYFTRKSTFCTG